MIRIWICLAFIAISGCAATYIESDENNGWYDDYWYYDDNDKLQADVKETAKTTTELEDTKTSPSTFRIDAPNINDYLLEDNRSELADDSNTSNDSGVANDTSLHSTEGLYDDKSELTSTEIDVDKKENYDDLAYSSNDIEEKILKETEAILNEDVDNDFTEHRSTEMTEKELLDSIIENTNRILNDTSDSMDELTDDDKIDKDGEEIDSGLQSLELISKNVTESTEDDTVAKAYSDLMSDLDKLQKTWNALRDFDDKNVQSSEDDDNLYDYEEIDDANLEQLFEKTVKDNEEDEVKSSTENISESASQEVNRMSEPILYLNDALMASEAENTKTDIDFSTTIVAPIESSHDAEIFATTTEASVPEEVSTTPSDIEELSSAEIDRLIIDFNAMHKNEMKITSDDVRNAVNIRLSPDSPLEVTSPNYPDRYPTGNTVDWMIRGDGMGIELNVTDFAVNGFNGDYVLIKPGGEDESGRTGILFTYTLTKERRYRFLDVDKMFIRFVSNSGPMFMRGFSFSMRMVVPPPGLPIEEPEEEPEPIEIPDPPATISLNLGGVSLEGFIQVEEQFRQIIADMATLYINTHNIDPGMNTTLQSTQITSKALCFHNWPKFELCTEVRFGVPIVYEEEEGAERRPARLNETDLMDMWSSFSQRDPFAVRLRMLGITEYQVPNDRGILTIWLVIAGGVVLSMAMLAFALWRFSCFADYTRMPSFSDTDSVKEKRNLDLYPTPHQTLPPLFSETDYKWADAKYDDSAKVDMSGYSNRNYMHEPYEIDSDEEVMPAHDRKSAFSPRDIYNA